MIYKNFPITIRERFDYPVAIDTAGLFFISMSARVKSAKQINSTDDEDLQIEIDGRTFREIPPLDKPQYKNIPPAFNGSELKGLKKTAVFFIWLEKGLHILSLIPDHSAIIEKVAVEKIKDIQNVALAINEQAEDGDRRPWFAFIFVDLSVKEMSASIIAQSRWFDRDDAQIKIDGKIQSYKNADILHRFWYWIGALLKGKEEIAYFKPNLSEEIHYVEINADRMPLLQNVSFILGDALSKGIITDTNHNINETKFRREPKRAEDNIISEIPVGEEEALQKALAGYNWGQNYVPQNSLFKQIQIPENVKQYVKEVLDYKKEFEQNGFSRIKIIVSVLFAFIFFVIIANVIQSLNYSSNVDNNVFYFFATTGFACGSGGCSYVFYKYQALADTLEALDVQSIVGSPPKIFLSPGVRKAAVLSHMHGGISCISAYLFVFDLATGEKNI